MWVIDGRDWVSIWVVFGYLSIIRGGYCEYGDSATVVALTCVGANPPRPASLGAIPASRLHRMVSLSMTCTSLRYSCCLLIHPLPPPPPNTTMNRSSATSAWPARATGASPRSASLVHRGPTLDSPLIDWTPGFPSVSWLPSWLPSDSSTPLSAHRSWHRVPLGPCPPKSRCRPFCDVDMAWPLRGDGAGDEN